MNGAPSLPRGPPSGDTAAARKKFFPPVSEIPSPRPIEDERSFKNIPGKEAPAVDHPISDRQLALLLANDPQKGLAAAIHRYGGAVRTICASILGGQPEEVEEAVSDSFLALWRELERYDPGRPLASWLYGIARRTALSRRRALGRRPFPEELPEELPEEGPDLTELAAAKENARLLRQAVDRLPQPDREIFIRRYYLYEQVKEIAARLGLPEKAVENRLFRGRRRLRRELMGGVIL